MISTQPVINDSSVPQLRASPARDADLLASGLGAMELRERIDQAQEFHARFLQHADVDAAALRLKQAPEWAAKFIRRNDSIPRAVVAKLGANTIAKRRPENTEAFLDYITRCFELCKPLTLRVVFGPVKNVQRYGAYQLADMAEYLTLIQLARVVESIAAIYPHGVKVQLVPDDQRGQVANAWPAFYSSLYVSSLQRMVANLRFEAWLQVEAGQKRLYEQYRVADHVEEARAAILADATFEKKFAAACSHARSNLFSQDDDAADEKEIAASAMRYLVAHKAESLSGMWSPTDALPLMYANHPGNYQLYTLGRGLTKLPWQVRLPFAVLNLQERNLVPLPIADRLFYEAGAMDSGAGRFIAAAANP